MLFIKKDKTLVSSLSVHEVMAKIANHTQELNDDYELISPSFTGKLQDDTFRISPVIRTPQNGVPLLIGSVEATSQGSIIFIRTRLFPGAKLYLRFSSLLAMIVAFTFLLIAKSMVGFLICTVIAFANWLILKLNFDRRTNKALKKLSSILTKPQE